MKIKSDFITNSSSTSFILGDFRKNKESIKIKVEHDLIENGLVHYTINNLKEFKEFLKKEEGYLSDDEMEKCYDIINKGGTVYLCSAMSDDSILQAGLYEWDDKIITIPEGMTIIKKNWRSINENKK